MAASSRETCGEAAVIVPAGEEGGRDKGGDDGGGTYGLGKIVSTLSILTHLIFTTTHQVVTVIIPILEMRKQTQKDV